ncbi:MAG TPA: hypothetical protein VNX68_19525 [Nitrosopumilaceae archaeon]|jgi:hypothetical protein|nr:hypothetical protein [Nitrosopumilaceae archaeon]
MEYERIEFSKNWNNKLLCDVFSTIRPSYKDYNIDEVFDVRIGERFFCYAKVLKSEIKTLKEIISSGAQFVDTGLNGRDFLILMSNMYSKKSWWKGEDTEMKIIFLQKIQQLSIFDDGKFPNAT